jgi:hypothetical protein
MLSRSELMLCEISNHLNYKPWILGWYWTATAFPMDPTWDHISGYCWMMDTGNKCLQSSLWDMEGLYVRCIKD